MEFVASRKSTKNDKYDKKAEEMAISNNSNNAFLEGSRNNNDYVSNTDMEDIGVATKKMEDDIQFEAQLPQGKILTSVLGIHIPSEEAGNVLQFLEFCSAFGKALDLKEGQVKSVVRELFSSGCTNRQHDCHIVPMMIQLLDLISSDRNIATNNNWFTATGDVLLKSGVLGDDFPPETFKAGFDEYTKMDASRKLRLLNFLCDESLSTRAMRNHIKNKNAEFEEKKKEAKKNVAAAIEKEKQLRQTLKNDLLAKAHMENNGAPLSIEKHKAIMSQIKDKAKEAHEEVMEAKKMTSIQMKSCDAVRSDPIITDDNGRVLWRLNCFEEEPKFFLQDLGTFDNPCPHEKWLAFTAEQEQEIEHFLSSKRAKPIRTKNNANVKRNAKATASESAQNPKAEAFISNKS